MPRRKPVRIKSREIQRDAALRRKYGISLTDFNRIAERQDFRCAICKNKTKRLVVDHDHTFIHSRSTRELLCAGCNLGLGHFKDDPERLLEAARYLQKHRSKTEAYLDQVSAGLVGPLDLDEWIS